MAFLHLSGAWLSNLNIYSANQFNFNDYITKFVYLHGIVYATRSISEETIKRFSPCKLIWIYN